MSMNPNTVWQLLNLGWSVTYGVSSISFSCHRRSIRVHDSGHVEVVDGREPHSAPARHDQLWATAFELLEVDLGRLQFNPFLRLWAYPLGTSRTRAGRNERVRSAQ